MRRSFWQVWNEAMRHRDFGPNNDNFNFVDTESVYQFFRREISSFENEANINYNIENILLPTALFATEDCFHLIRDSRLATQAQNCILQVKNSINSGFKEEVNFELTTTLSNNALNYRGENYNTENFSTYNAAISAADCARIVYFYMNEILQNSIINIRYTLAEAAAFVPTYNREQVNLSILQRKVRQYVSILHSYASSAYAVGWGDQATIHHNEFNSLNKPTTPNDWFYFIIAVRDVLEANDIFENINGRWYISLPKSSSWGYNPFTEEHSAETEEELINRIAFGEEPFWNFSRNYIHRIITKDFTYEF